MDLLRTFTAHVEEKGYWIKGEHVLVAVSGGVDSVVLLDLISHLPDRCRPAMTVLHVDHGLREVSTEEAAFVRELASSYGADCLVRRWSKKDHPTSGFEAAARKIRYAFFKEAAANCHASKLLTAHHRDDQVETVLMRLVRGNSLHELAGIQAVRADAGFDIYRPLLPFAKNELIAYAEQNGLKWCEDESNASNRYTRNRFRHSIIPLLKKENPMLEEHVIQFSEELQGLLDLLDPLISSQMQEIVDFQEQKMVISRRQLLDCAPVLQLKVLAKAFSEWAIRQDFMIKRVHLTLLRDWLDSGKPNSSLNLPSGLEAVRSYDFCIVRLKEKEAPSAYLESRNALVYDLEPGTSIELSEGKVIKLFTSSQYQNESIRPEARHIYLDLKPDQLPLKVRHRQQGDRLKVKGMNGTKKVKDIFIDQKVPLADREQAWLVTDHHGELIWLVDYKESALSLDPITDTISYVLVYTDPLSKGV
ncbi:tRNA(Ile)-lysidine synthetase [Alkalibacterium sp. AK22]|uniref:tRNA lysidine(34) synthetase TilS n=1 Tax=Alkalibacterium sp. AK22 TaxID=1229520 RepID=UPI000451331E|nr:tRNA lysidine(34) synthetase TilS [Alkalibacterium sp. AK22]EXJ23436.1 tRNA(Ile)-lysidine synthetase [Alkalibacterium sp. AK22]